MTETVSCEIVLGDGRPWREHVPVLRLSWSAGDPLAVVSWSAPGRRTRRCCAGAGWCCGTRCGRCSAPAAGRRRAGSAPRPAGHVPMSRTDEHVTLTLRSASLPCVVTVPAGPMREFLAETDAIVPPGGEPWAPALDAEIARMLGAE